MQCVLQISNCVYSLLMRFNLGGGGSEGNNFLFRQGERVGNLFSVILSCEPIRLKFQDGEGGGVENGDYNLKCFNINRNN